MTKPFVVSETELVEKMKTFLDECDSDEQGTLEMKVSKVNFYQEDEMVGDILIFCTAILIFCIFVSVAKDISNSSQKDDNKKNIKKYAEGARTNYFFLNKKQSFCFVDSRQLFLWHKK